MTSYDDALDRLERFVAKLPTTNVEFIFFLANENKPSYRDEFKKCNHDGQTYYISHGFSKNFIYAYRESDIKYIVSVLGRKKTQPATIFDVDVHAPGGDCNLGNHVDYSINRQKNGDILIRTHLTVYEDDAANPTNFVRSESHCNFMLDASQLDTFDDFKLTKCAAKPPKIPKIDISYTYEEPDQKIVYKLTRLVSGLDTPSGGAKRPKQPASIKLKIVEDFLYDKFITKLHETHEIVHQVLLIYDKNRQRYKKYIVALVDYNDRFRRAYYLDANIVFRASLAHRRISEGKKPGKRQAQAYAAFAESVDKIAQHSS